jgi:hypothetical protein
MSVLMKSNIKIKKAIYRELGFMVSRNFVNCFPNGKEEEGFYSPFILGLIGVFLINIKNKEIEIILEKIDNKLLNTFNVEGIYNFYGNDSYYFDVDTSAIVNSYLILRHKNPVDCYKLIERLKQKMDLDTGLYSTWLNREINHVDWIVNLNLYFLETLIKGKSNLENSLKISFKEYLKFGSRYYINTSFPLFWLKHIQKEFNLLLDLSKYETSFEHIVSDFKIESKNLDVTGIDNIIYFNSSKDTFNSKELSLSIISYLINKQ